jgi:WD40-like Beta Propeller Repeat
MDRGNRPVRAALIVGFASLLLAVGAVPARAAFPGANGLLVVQPASGRGLLLVGPEAGHPRQICTVEPRCDRAMDPVWSPDGSEIAFASPRGSGPSVIYPDGSCLACPAPALETSDPVDRAFGPGFLPDGRLGVWVDNDYPSEPQLGAINTDGIGFRPFKVSGHWQQPAWSSTGQLAAVRSVKRTPEVFVINPSPGRPAR